MYPISRRLNFLMLALLLFTCTSVRQAPLVDVTTLDPTFVLDVRYATTDNFTRKQVYPIAKVALRKAPAESLCAVQAELRTLRLRLKLFDGYRPLTVQKRFWEILPDPRYVANPATGSRHNRGAAIDVSLVDSLGQELEMPTGYDDFSEKAHQDYDQCSDRARANRALLQRVMKRHGFQSLATEWWHFDFKGWEAYPIMDVPLERIQ